MERYMIETPHTAQNCVALLDQTHARGYLVHFDWGCLAGVHTGWAVIEAENEAQARMAVPPLVRGEARITRLNKFGVNELTMLHAKQLEPDGACFAMCNGMHPI